MKVLSFKEFDELLTKVEFVLFSDDEVFVTPEENVIFSETAKEVIHQFAADCRESDYYKDTLGLLKDFWNGDSEYFTITPKNVYRVILEKQVDTDSSFLALMAIVTHIPVLDEALNGPVDLLKVEV